MQLTDLAALEDQFNRDLHFQLDMVSRDPAALEQLNQFLFGYVPGLRFYAMADTDEVNRVWTHIRSRDVVTDVVFDLTSSLVFTADLTESSWTKLIGGLAAAWGCMVPEQGAAMSMLMLDEENERFADRTRATALITANPWLATLYFLRRSDYVSKHIGDAAVRAAQAYQAEKNRGAPQ